ncbi:MAG TPA: hypothetical protein PKY82_12025 [Pyrinomonadaceae bacterium]|nr:hypothetical protein [Pyrinomonadaceae bacterium]
MRLPKAKTNNLVTQQSGKELLLYDLTNNQAYCLNETATIIYQFCDGEKSSNELKIQHNFSDELIYLALVELKRQNLLEENYNLPFDRISRRQVVKKIGFSSLLALPVISSIVAPTAAATLSSCTPPGQFSGNYSIGNFCGFYPSSTYEEFCDGFNNRCCSNNSNVQSCTTLPGNPPGSPPFGSVICFCAS